MKTEFTEDGLMISAQDLSGISPDSDDDERMFQHNGSATIPLVGGSSTSERGFYIWDAEKSAWYPSFQNANMLGGKTSGEFIHRDGSLSMEGDLDLSHNGLINVDSLKSGVGEILLNSNNLSINSLSAGSNVQLNDSNNLLLLDAQEGGDVDVPNGALNEQGSRVATRTWTNANADVPNADYADNAGLLGGNDSSSFLKVSGDQMEGALDLGGFDLNDGGSQIYDSTNGVFIQSTLGGPSSSLTSYPLPAGDLAEDYAVTSRFPIPNTDIANSDVTVTAGNQLTGGGSVSLGGTITVDVDETSLDADTVDGSHASDLGSGASDGGVEILSTSTDFNFGNALSVSDDGDGTVTIDGSKYTDTEAVSAVNAETSLSVDISGDADTLDGNHAADLSGIQSGDPIPHAVYASTTDVPALDEGDVVYISGKGLHVEDGT
jgi:hypothetical protein